MNLPAVCAAPRFAKQSPADPGNDECLQELPLGCWVFVSAPGAAALRRSWPSDKEGGQLCAAKFQSWYLGENEEPAGFGRDAWHRGRILYFFFATRSSNPFLAFLCLCAFLPVPIF